MDSSWPRRGLAIVVLLLVGVAIGAPVMAHTAHDLEDVIEEFVNRSEDKLAWLEDQLDDAETSAQRLEAYQIARGSLQWYSEDAVDDLFVIAGSHPDLVEQAQQLAALVAQMEQQFLGEAEALYTSSGSGSETTTTISQTTTTVKPTPSTTTTSTTLPRGTSTTTSTSTTTTTTAISKTTPTTSTTTSSSTVPAPTTTTTTTTIPTASSTVPTFAPPSAAPSQSFIPNLSGETPAPTTTIPDTEFSLGASVTQGNGAVSPPGASEFLAAFGDPLSAEEDSGEQAAGLAALFRGSEEEVAAIVRSVDSLPVTGLLIGYVPAGLPDGLAAPVVGLMAIFEMIVGAFVASIRQLGGPLSAAGTYLAYSIWRHLVSKT